MPSASGSLLWLDCAYPLVEYTKVSSKMHMEARLIRLVSDSVFIRPFYFIAKIQSFASFYVIFVRIFVCLESIIMDLPKAFSEYMKRLMGEAACQRLESGLAEEPQVSIRLNERKLKSFWDRCPVPLSADVAVPWCRSGHYLKDRPSFTFDPLFHAGAYYVQEAGSMFLEQAFSVLSVQEAFQRPLMALDLCAAPGGKSTHLRSLLPAGSFLVSNEPMRPRAQVLSENIQKWGDPACLVTNGYPADFSPLEHLFDVVVADVPCSGEGMFRKDEGAIADWSPENVELCWKRQRSIIADIWPALKPGGYLIYSTCTFNAYEDEDNVSWIARELGADLVQVPCADEWGIQGDLTGKGLPVYHFLPGWTRGEGFFLALLRKHGQTDEAEEGWRTCLPRKASKKGKAEKKGKGKSEAPSVPLAELAAWLRGEPDCWEWLTDVDLVSAVPAEWGDACRAVRECLAVMHCGVPVAELKGRDWVPRHGLALSLACRQERFPQVELSYEQAVAYLRKEALVLPPETPKGFVLLTYQKFPLGFAKQIGNRANNLYPDTWRIRSGYVTPCTVLNAGETV